MNYLWGIPVSALSMCNNVITRVSKNLRLLHFAKVIITWLDKNKQNCIYGEIHNWCHANMGMGNIIFWHVSIRQRAKEKVVATAWISVTFLMLTLQSFLVFYYEPICSLRKDNLGESLFLGFLKEDLLIFL